MRNNTTSKLTRLDLYMIAKVKEIKEAHSIIYL